MAAHGEEWIAKEVYRRELMNIKMSCKDIDPSLKVVMEWLEQKCQELDERCKG